MKKQDFIFLCTVLAATALNLWRVRYGFPSTDESFFVSVIHRLWLGDMPLVQIYNPIQFAAMLGVPLESIFVKMTGSTDGIFIFFRLVYMSLMLIASLFAYYKTRNEGWIAMFPPVIILLFSSLQIMDFSYGTIGLFNILMMSLLLAFPNGHNRRNGYFAGIFYALAVLCTPHLAVLYFAGSLYLLVCILMKRNIHRYAKMCWLPFTLGCVTAALSYVVPLLMRMPLSTFLNSFGNLFVTDTRNSTMGPVAVINTLALFKMIWLNNTVTAVIVPLYALLFLYCLKRNRKAENQVLMGLAMLFTLILLPAYRKPPYDYNMIAFVPLGMVGMVLDKNLSSSLRNMFLCGLGYVFMINLSSNTILNAAQHASTVCMVPALIQAYRICGEAETKKTLHGLLAVTCVVMLGCEITDRLTITWQDGSPLTMKERIDQGPAKGVITNTVHFERYEEDYAVLQPLLSGYEGNVLFYSEYSWMYLMVEPGGHAAVHSTWFEISKPTAAEHLEDYYQDHEEMVPNLVFLSRRDFEYKEVMQEVLSPYAMSMNEQGSFMVGVRGNAQ